jgi:hypothetical protein
MIKITKEELRVLDATIGIMQYISKYYKNEDSIKVLEKFNEKINEEYMDQNGDGDIEE